MFRYANYFLVHENIYIIHVFQAKMYPQFCLTQNSIRCKTLFCKKIKRKVPAYFLLINYLFFELKFSEHSLGPNLLNNLSCWLFKSTRVKIRRMTSSRERTLCMNSGFKDLLKGYEGLSTKVFFVVDNWEIEP